MKLAKIAFLLLMKIWDSVYKWFDLWLNKTYVHKSSFFFEMQNGQFWFVLLQNQINSPVTKWTYKEELFNDGHLIFQCSIFNCPLSTCNFYLFVLLSSQPPFWITFCTTVAQFCSFFCLLKDWVFDLSTLLFVCLSIFNFFI